MSDSPLKDETLFGREQVRCEYQAGEKFVTVLCGQRHR